MTVPADLNATSNPTTGQAILASWGDAVRDSIEYLIRNRPRCRVHNSAAISMVNNTVQALTFNSERLDVGGMHSTVTNTGRITVPAGEGGFYLCGGNISYAANATGVRQLLINVNGTTTIVETTIGSAGGANGTEIAVVTGYQLAAGDYLELLGYQNSGGALNAAVGASFAPEFWAIWQAA